MAKFKLVKQILKLNSIAQSSVQLSNHTWNEAMHTTTTLLSTMASTFQGFNYFGQVPKYCKTFDSTSHNIKAVLTTISQHINWIGLRMFDLGCKCIQSRFLIYTQIASMKSSIGEQCYSFIQEKLKAD